jgi:hypothetical protein
VFKASQSWENWGSPGISLIPWNHVPATIPQLKRQRRRRTTASSICLSIYARGRPLFTRSKTTGVSYQVRAADGAYSTQPEHCKIKSGRCYAYGVAHCEEGSDMMHIAWRYPTSWTYLVISGLLMINHSPYICIVHYTSKGRSTTSLHKKSDQ